MASNLSIFSLNGYSVKSGRRGKVQILTDFITNVYEYFNSDSARQPYLWYYYIRYEPAGSMAIRHHTWIWARTDSNSDQGYETMAKESVLQLRYLGVFPQTGHREYRFHIEKEDSKIRNVSLTIDDHFFGTKKLMFQEAPDLCYQKLLVEVRDETRDVPILSHAAVTETDIQSYRESHRKVRTRK
jgi:hypothetical protein